MIWRTTPDERHDPDLDLGAPYRPVFERSSGCVVGAELLQPVRSLALVRRAAQGFAFGPAADEGWWLAVGLPGGALAAADAVSTVEDLLHRSGLRPERLVLQVTSTELGLAVRRGTASRLGAMGVRCTLAGFGVHHWSTAAVRSLEVASVQVSLSGLDRAQAADVALLRSVVALARSRGIAVLGRDVESDQQLVLAGEVGIDLVEGYWWGSPGSLAKLVGTWARLPISG